MTYLNIFLIINIIMAGIFAYKFKRFVDKQDIRNLNKADMETADTCPPKHFTSHPNQ